MTDITLDDTNRLAEALSQLRSAIKDHPGNAQAHQNLAMFLLSHGRFDEGWPEYRWRLELPEMKYKARYSMFPVPQWEGESLTGKRVLAWLDQGIGDQILQATMIPDLAAEAGHVTVLAHRRLQTLLARALPDARVMTPTDDIVYDFDCQMCVHDLGTRYRRSFADFPGRTLLKTDPLPRYSDGLTVGVSWRSSNFRLGGHKSIPPVALTPLLTVPGVTFVNLQYGAAGDLPAHVIDDPTVDPLDNLDRFARQVAACDLVVTTSNTTLHVAGALGVRTIGLLPRGTGRYWYWFTDREDCPWYPSVQLLRQSAPGDWESLIGGVTELVRTEAADRPLAAVTESWKPMPEPACDELSRAKRRIAELERAIAPLLPWGDCDNFEFNAMVYAPGQSMAEMKQRLTKILRETVYTDVSEFKMLAKAMKNRWSDGALDIR